MQPMLNIALRAARSASELIFRSIERLDSIKVDEKEAKDYVSEVDRAAEQSIVNALRKAYPNHSIQGEETGLHAGSGEEGKDYLWIIDPLDGTTNFIHGFPNYAVSIALLHRGQPAHAVIYDPSRNEMFTASRGSGAFLNDRRVRVSGCTRYHDALLASHVPKSTALPADSPFSPMLADCAAARRTGSVVLDLAYVACGRLDGFCGVRLKPWDMAAGGLMVLEAGGLLSDFEGEQGWMASGNLLTATPKVFPQMIGYLSA